MLGDNSVEGLKQIQESLHELVEDGIMHETKKSEYILINNYLDLARYDTSKIISIARSQIIKVKKDQDILKRFEIGLGLQKREKKIKKEEDMVEKFKKSKNNKALEDAMKLDRINLALLDLNSTSSPS